MKKIVLASLLLAAVASAAAELPGYLEKIKRDYIGRLKVWGASEDDFEDDAGNQFIVLKFNASTDPQLPEDSQFLMRITMQVSDKKTDQVVFSHHEKKQPRNQYDVDYRWECILPVNQMKRPQLSAYTIELGFMQDSYFVPVATIYEQVDRAEQITGGNGTQVKMTCTHKAEWD